MRTGSEVSYLIERRWSTRGVAHPSLGLLALQTRKLTQENDELREGIERIGFAPKLVPGPYLGSLCDDPELETDMVA